MATIYHLDGFDHYESKTDDSPDDVWDRFPSFSIYRATALEAAARPDATAPANAKKRGLSFPNGSAANTTHGRYLLPDKSAVGPTIAVGFDFYMPTLPTHTDFLFFLRNGGPSSTVLIGIYITTGGVLQLRRGATTTLISSTALNTGQWYNIEFKVLIHDSAGTAEIKLDGVSDVSGTSLDTKVGADTTVDSFTIHGINRDDVYFDNLYIADDYLTTCRVDTFLPTGDGTYNSDFTKSGGSTQYELLDDYSALDGDTTNIESSTINHQFTQTFPTQAVGQTIHGVGVASVLKNDDGGTIASKSLLLIGGSDYLGADESTADVTYKLRTQCEETDPSDAAAWTDTKINATEFGREITS